MQGHRRLARARAALDDQDAGERGADDLVLLALDGADDVAHVAGAGLAEGGEQRARAAEHHPVGEQALAAGVAPAPSPLDVDDDGGRPAVGVDEVLVLEPDDAAAAHGQVAAAGQALGVEAGGPVEGFGHRGPPVDDQGLVVGARDGQAADVEGLAQRRSPSPGLGEPVDAAEVEGLVPDVELLQPGQAGAHDDVALGARLEGATPAQVEHALQHLARLAPHELQPVIGTVEELLLILQIGMFGHRSPFSPAASGKRVQFRRRPKPGMPRWGRLR